MQAYAIKAATQWMVRRRHEVEAQAKAGSGAVGVDALLDDLPELHATGAGLKALCCVLAADGIEDLRRSCGGAGPSHHMWCLDGCCIDNQLLSSLPRNPDSGILTRFRCVVGQATAS